MFLRWSLLVFLTITLLLGSCERPPDLPEEPSIEYENLEFKISETGQDSLIITIRFQDGNGDLGLENGEIFYPYNEKNFLLEDGTDTFQVDNIDVLVTFSESNGEPPFNFDDWLILENIVVDLDTITDTVRIVRNENFSNIFVDFFLKSGNDFEKIDLFELLGADFNGRFPVLNPDGVDSDRPLEGSLRYSMRSFGFIINPVLRNETLKLKIRIKDRALNTSNEVETPEFSILDLAQD